MGPPRLPKDLPPGFAEVLPKATVQQLRAIHANAALTPDQQHAQIDKIMSSLPNEVLDRLPQPPFFDKLPKATRDQLKAIHRDRTLTWRQRHEKIHAVLESLPPNLRPHPPPHPPSGGEPTDIDIPEQALREVEDFGVGRALVWLCDDQLRSMPSIIFTDAYWMAGTLLIFT
ncbi:unnamed protein product [Heligmosomoides polygyrus]|uniref:XPGN domain-containing protein n=1 Tax=Heligmosomoides polygyrus TaxID=6339 RepID=A0A183F421_HELPZ|nr:unnamed protein product [Heligmosomoides polygyrus]